MLSSSTIWNLWNEFWISKQHQFLTPASLIADKTSTALFTVAGMQPLIPYLSWQEHPLGARLYNIQPCIRTNDLEDVGDNSHHTMFFMMGNWSLGDYFKKDAVSRSREFLTQYLKLDPRKLAVTVYEGDDEVPADNETANLWKAQGIPEHKISYLTADDNRRSPGPIWPCGPCTEMYYWIGETEFPDETDNVKKDDSQWLEIWNNVFMEYYRDESGKLTKLEKQNVDTGMGFERICKVLQLTLSPYETDLFLPIISTIEQATRQSYIADVNNPISKSMRIIADHMRSSCFLIAEWLIPSNEGRWYVLRRIIRRLYFQLHELLGEKAIFSDIMNSCSSIIESIILTYQEWFPIISDKKVFIAQVIEKELQQFAKTLSQGQKILEKYINELWTDNVLNGEKIFMLYDTFWFPPELTEEIAQKRGVSLDKEGFEQAMEIAKEKSRTNTAKINTKDIDRSVHTAWLQPTHFIWYTDFKSESTCLKTIEFDNYKVLIFDQTPFYATMGGQLHDIGTIEDNGIIYTVFDVQQYNSVFLHFVR